MQLYLTIRCEMHSDGIVLLSLSLADIIFLRGNTVLWFMDVVLLGRYWWSLSDFKHVKTIVLFAILVNTVVLVLYMAHLLLLWIYRGGL